MANVKYSAFPSVAISGGATQSVGLQGGLNVRFPVGTAAAPVFCFRIAPIFMVMVIMVSV
jgi:hypothetical protein